MMHVPDANGYEGCPAAIAVVMPAQAGIH
jgi:hypothetical protein